MGWDLAAYVVHPMSKCLKQHTQRFYVVVVEQPAFEADTACRGMDVVGLFVQRIV